MIDQSVERLHLFINAQRGLQHQSMSESGWPFPLTQPWFHHVKQSLQVLPLKIAYQWASSPQWIIWAGTLPCHTVSKSPLSVCWCAALALWLYKSGLGPFVWLDWSCCSLFMKGRNLSAFLFINQDWHCHCPKKDLCKMWPLLPVVLLTSDTKQILALILALALMLVLSLRMPLKWPWDTYGWTFVSVWRKHPGLQGKMSTTVIGVFIDKYILWWPRFNLQHLQI